MYLTSQNPKTDKPRALLQQYAMEFKKANGNSSTAIQAQLFKTFMLYTENGGE